MLSQCQYFFFKRSCSIKQRYVYTFDFRLLRRFLCGWQLSQWLSHATLSIKVDRHKTGLCIHSVVLMSKMFRWSLIIYETIPWIELISWKCDIYARSRIPLAVIDFGNYGNLTLSDIWLPLLSCKTLTFYQFISHNFASRNFAHLFGNYEQTLISFQ